MWHFIRTAQQLNFLLIINETNQNLTSTFDNFKIQIYIQQIERDKRNYKKKNFKTLKNKMQNIKQFKK